MKRTSSMYYEKSDASRELVLYAENNRQAYKMIYDVVENMKRKYRKGIYDADKAIDAFYRVATYASDLYNKEFGYRFSVQERFTAATELSETYFAEYVENEN